MPFRNTIYSGERLFPIKENHSKKAVRVWINNGTSIDRIITITSDSIFGKTSKLIEIGFLEKGGKDKKIFNEKDMIPKSGFEKFFKIVESLKLIDYSTQESFDYVVNHQPFSLYVIEIKMNNKYNLFEFRTHFPDTSMTVENKYELIQKLIFEEFDYNFYMK